MRPILVVTLALALLPACAGSGKADAGAEAEDAPGLRVGAQAPDVTLYADEDQPVTLASLYEEQPIVLMFYQGGWNPFCQRALRNWNTRVDAVRAAGGEIVAVTPETPAARARTVERNDIQYRVLGDPTLAAAKAFGLEDTLDDEQRQTLENNNIDLTQQNASGSWELPAPGIFIIDTTGTIRYADASWDHMERARPADVIEALADIDAR